MLRELSISDYRSLRCAKFSDFAQVNVLVGSNGAGKTSFLEALYLFLAQGSPEAIIGVAKRRGEYEKLQDKREWVPTVRHFFYGHEVRQGASTIALKSGEDALSFSIEEKKFVLSDKGNLEVLSLSANEPYVMSGQTLTMNVGHTTSDVVGANAFSQMQDRIASMDRGVFKIESQPTIFYLLWER